jgi:hypothetical protein
VWDLGSARPVFTLSCPRQVDSVRFTGGGKVLLAFCGTEVHPFDASTGQPLGPALLHSSWARSAAVSPDGRWLASLTQDRQLHLWDLAGAARAGASQRLARLLSGQEVSGSTTATVGAGRLAGDWSWLRDRAADELLARPDDVWRWHDRRASILLGQRWWRAAALQMAYWRPPGVTEAWQAYLAGTCHLAAGDLPALRRHCRALLAHADKAEELGPIDWAVKLSLIRRDTFADLAPVLALAPRLEKAKANDPQHAWFLASRGLALYREGKHDESAGWLEKGRSLKGRPAGCAVLLDVLLALVRGKQGKKEEARRLLALAEKGLTGQQGQAVSWIDQEQIRFLLVEAHETVGNGAED